MAAAAATGPGARGHRRGDRLNYVDPAAFGRLFAAPRANHALICEVVHRIAAERACGYAWPNEHDREDAVADAACHAIAQLAKFDRRRKAKAFTYFTRVIERHFWRSWERDKRNRVRHIGIDEAM